jgi:hypothetical protein
MDDETMRRGRWLLIGVLILGSPIGLNAMMTPWNLRDLLLGVPGATTRLALMPVGWMATLSYGLTLYARARTIRGEMEDARP